MNYFGFALADSMFEGECTVKRTPLSIDDVKGILDGSIESCLNPSHGATIQAMNNRFGLHVAIPETPPKVTLRSGDSIVVMGVRGLARLTDRHEYTEEEIAAASFNFSKYSVE